LFCLLICWQALSVGIFPYVLKLLQSSARELRPLLVFIWSKLLAVDSVRNDLSVCSHKIEFFGTCLSFDHGYVITLISENDIGDGQNSQTVCVICILCNLYRDTLSK
jgi:hypothetical protein